MNASNLVLRTELTKGKEPTNRMAVAQSPSDQVLRWAASAVDGTSVVSAESLGSGGHRASGTFRLRIEGAAARATDVILKVPVPGWIPDVGVITNARALQRAETHGLAAPRLIAADLDGRVSGTVATLETFLSGSADLPPTVSVARLREAGAAIARVHAVSMAPRARLAYEQDRMLAGVLLAVLDDSELALSAAQRDVLPLVLRKHGSRMPLPYRSRPIGVDDRAAERRRGSMPTTPLLQEADEWVRSHGVPTATSVFLHGDVWAGNMLFEGDRCVALIDWKTAGVGDPGVDLGSLRMQMALRYGQDAPASVLEGWERQAGRAAIAVPFWDAVAALNTPTVMDGWPGFADDGSPLDAAAVTDRRDVFLRTALDQLPA
jgi:aminoglycoside phosphotransferase (APT) family kinase protein